MPMQYRSSTIMELGETWAAFINYERNITNVYTFSLLRRIMKSLEVFEIIELIGFCLIQTGLIFLLWGALKIGSEDDA